MKILVTGGAGFIGTNFVSKAYGLGHTLIVLDKLTYAGGRDNLAAFDERVQLLIGDICNPAIVEQAMDGVEIVVHFAAESHNTRSEINPDLFYQTNLQGTQCLLDRAAQVSTLKSFIHISTDEVYGSIDKGFFAEIDKERGDHQATSAYSKSKSLADDRVLDAGARGLPVMVLRPTNNFGAWQYPEKALPRWITNLLTGGVIPLWGEGRQIRDWLYACETAAAIFFLLEYGRAGEAYNLAANHNPEVTNRQAAELLCRLLGKSPETAIQLVPDPRPNHDFRYALNMEKLTRLGWRPSIDLEQQFRETIHWYQTQRAWWQQRKAEAETIYQ